MFSLILRTIFCLCLCTWAAGAWAIDPYAGVDPYWVLLHEPAVQQELQLSDAQQKEFTALLDGLDAKFFPLRNKSQEVATAGIAEIVSTTQQELNSLLKPAQLKRVSEILFRKRGNGALLDKELGEKLRITESQRRQLATIVEEAETAVKLLREELAAGKPREPLEKQYTEVRTDEQRKISALFTVPQRTAWQELLGEPFDLGQLGRPAYRAPELVAANVWINRAIMKLEHHRGKVVVVNFYASGCINCIHNYPSYRQWQADYDDRGVVMLGIHTPETDAERVVESVTQKAVAEKLTYSILIDGDSKNWNAWGNSMWPSVYLIDKRGYLRDFWPGELKWQGQDGDAYLRKRIEELLAE